MNLTPSKPELFYVEIEGVVPILADNQEQALTEARNLGAFKIYANVDFTAAHAATRLNGSNDDEEPYVAKYCDAKVYDAMTVAEILAAKKAEREAAAAKAALELAQYGPTDLLGISAATSAESSRRL